MVFIIKSFWNIVFIFIVISTTFWLIYPPAYFRCLSTLGTYTELRTMSIIGSTGLAHLTQSKVYLYLPPTRQDLTQGQ